MVVLLLLLLWSLLSCLAMLRVFFCKFLCFLLLCLPAPFSARARQFHLSFVSYFNGFKIVQLFSDTVKAVSWKRSTCLLNTVSRQIEEEYLGMRITTNIYIILVYSYLLSFLAVADLRHGLLPKSSHFS